MINKFQNGGVNRSLYQQMSDQWQQSYNNYLNGLDKAELPAGLHYNENGEAVMPPDEVIKRGYTFLTDNTGKVKLLDKDNKVIFDDVQNQPNLHDWIDKNKLWNKPKSLSEASQVASIRNPEGMKTIRDAFQWGGNVAGGFIAAPALAVGASEFAPYLYSKAPQVVDKAMRLMNPGSAAEMALGKDAATQAVRTGISAVEKYPWLMANTWQGATANGLWMSGGSAAALNEAKQAFSGESTNSKAAAALNAGLAIPFMPIRGVENAEMLLKLPFLRNAEGNLNQFGLFLNRGPWKQSKTLWRQFHKKGDAPYNESDAFNWMTTRNKQVNARINPSVDYFKRKYKSALKQIAQQNKQQTDTRNQILLLKSREYTDPVTSESKFHNFKYNYYVIDPSARKLVDDDFTGITNVLHIPKNNPEYQVLKYNVVEEYPSISIHPPSTSEEIANFRAYRQSINDILKEDGLVAGSTVGYSRGYIQGGMNNDTEIITTRSRLADAQRKMKFTKVGENSIGGINGTSPLAKGKTNQVEYDIIDEDASGNATGTLAHQIFQALHPEEARQFYKAHIDKEIPSYTLSLPIKAEQLLQELRQEGNMEKVQMIDMFGAGINVKNPEAFKKHATRAYNVLLNPEFIPQVRSTLDLMLHKQFGPKVEQFSSKISDFTNVDDNKRFLNEIINANKLKYFSPEQVEEIAKNPEQMRNIFDYYNMNNFIGNRGMHRFSPFTRNYLTPSELREGFNANIQFGGGAGSGVGLNMTSGAWKAGDSYGSITGTRLLRTTYDSNPQSIPDWITQYRRITDWNNFPTSLFNEVGKPGEIARIEAESRKLNLPIWRHIATDRSVGAYNGSYAGPLYYETNPDNVFILHGVFPENGGLFTPRFRSYFGKPLLEERSTHDNLLSYDAQHPFEFLKSKGYEIRNYTDEDDKYLNSIARHYPLDKVYQHLLNRYNNVESLRGHTLSQSENILSKIHKLETSIYTQLQDNRNQYIINNSHIYRYNKLNNYERSNNRRKVIPMSILGTIIPYAINKTNQSANEYDMTQSAKQFAIANDLNNLSYDDKVKLAYGINLDTLPKEQKQRYYDGIRYNIPKELVDANIQDQLVSNLLDAELTESDEARTSYINKINELIKSYGYQIKINNGKARFIKQ